MEENGRMSNVEEEPGNSVKFEPPRSRRTSIAMIFNPKRSRVQVPHQPRPSVVVTDDEDGYHTPITGGEGYIRYVL